jgi:hypothetical protein
MDRKTYERQMRKAGKMAKVCLITYRIRQEDWESCCPFRTDERWEQYHDIMRKGDLSSC